MLERWKPRKGAKPASAAELESQRSSIANRIGDLEAERAEIEAIMPSLSVTDPEHAVEANERLANLTVEMPTMRRTLSLIVAAITEAEKREAIESLERRKAIQDATSERRARELPRRYAAAVEALTAIFREIEADADACSALRLDAERYGLRGVWSAEYRARKDLDGATRGGFQSVTDARILNWDGSHAWWHD